MFPYTVYVYLTRMKRYKTRKETVEFPSVPSGLKDCTVIFITL